MNKYKGLMLLWLEKQQDSAFDEVSERVGVISNWAPEEVAKFSDSSMAAIRDGEDYKADETIIV